MAAARMTKESRRALRHSHDSVLELLSGPYGARIDAARLLDVSAGGASFTTSLPLAKGERVRGRMRLLGAGVLEFVGVVVRIKEKKNSTLYAVEFESVRGIPQRAVPGT